MAEAKTVAAAAAADKAAADKQAAADQAKAAAAKAAADKKPVGFGAAVGGGFGSGGRLQQAGNFGAAAGGAS